LGDRFLDQFAVDRDNARRVGRDADLFEQLSSRRASPSASPTRRVRAASSNERSASARSPARSKSWPISSSASGCSTYTVARERSAELTSNDGFSVVAPMKVSRPLSTKGRKPSCCALLKRWISSTKRMVRRPWSRHISACATASRTSLMPENTADSAMNSHANCVAIIRASVVLPTPGGPHRIIECGWPDAKARRSGLPGPSRCCWPITSSGVCGRNCSASGAKPGLLRSTGNSGEFPENRSLKMSYPCASRTAHAEGPTMSSRGK
jgi:hypothetical protein